ADGRVNLVGNEIEVDVDEGLDGAKSLGDPGQLENGRDLGHLLPTRRTSMPRFLAAFTESAGARSSLMTRRSRSVGQKVAIATRSHFVWSKTPITSLAVTTIALLSSASSALTSVRPSSSVKPTAPTNAFWMFSWRSIVAPHLPTRENASQRTAPPGMRTVMLGRPASSIATRIPFVTTVSSRRALRTEARVFSSITRAMAWRLSAAYWLLSIPFV